MTKALITKLCTECGASYSVAATGKGTDKENKKKFREHLSTHHIDYNKLNTDPSNFVTLCKPCHAKTLRNRHYWQEFLSSLKAVRLTSREGGDACCD